MFLILLLIAIILCFVYVKLKYFTLRGPIPGIPPQFLFGNLLQTGLITGSTYSVIYTALQKRFGDVCQMWFGHERFIIISNPDDAQHIFLNRHKYEQGKIFTDKLGILLPKGIIASTGEKLKNFVCFLFRC